MKKQVLISLALALPISGSVFAGPAETRHLRAFGYVQIEKGTGRQVLRRATLDRLDGTSRLRISEFFPPVTLATIVGESGTALSAATLEGYQILKASPDNRYVAALSFQSNATFVDYNIRVYDLATGLQAVFLNEHSIGALNRSNCRSETFERFLAARAASGEDSAEVLAAYDYRINADGVLPTGGIVGWTNNTRLRIRFGVPLSATNGLTGSTFDKIGDGAFELEVDVPSATPFVFYNCNTPSPLAALPKSPVYLATATDPSPYVHRTVLFRKQPIHYVDRSTGVRKELPLSATQANGYPR